MTCIRRLLAGALALGAVVGTTACGDAGDLSIRNDGPDDVTISTGDEESEVSAGGGVVILDYGCTPGDVTVRFADGRTAVVPGPVCPDEEIVVGDGRVDVRPLTSNGTRPARTPAVTP